MIKTKIEWEIKQQALNKVGDDLLNLITSEIFTKSQENLVEPDERGRIITDTGALMRSGYMEIEKRRAAIVYDAPYASEVEFGSDPHYVPLNVLVKWSKRKLKLKEEEAIAFAKYVQKKIAEKGTEPRRFLRNAMDEVALKWKK